MTLSNIVLCSIFRMDTEKLKKFFKSQRLTFATFLSVILGVVAGCIIRATSSTRWHQRDIMYLNFVGEVFMRMLKCLILPLMASSIMTAIGSLDLSLSKKNRCPSSCILYNYNISVCCVGNNSNRYYSARF